MLATGASELKQLTHLKTWRETHSFYVFDCRPEGVEKLQEAHEDVDIFIAKIR